MTRNDQLAIFIFSYNRGPFLENCLGSILELMPDCPRYILDDGSDDPGTRDTLARFADRFDVRRPDVDHAAERKTGGLYGNMNHAMRVAAEAGYRRVLFIQDDMQLVRPFNRRDLAMVDDYFADNDDCMQLATTFIRRLSSRRFMLETALDQSRTAYFRGRQFERGKSNFSAIGIFDVGRFLDRFEQFLPGEANNSRKAMGLGIRCGHSAYPFMNWTPYPTSFRARSRSGVHLLTEWLGGSGLHPITTMDDELVRRFLDRDPRQIPIMEDWLAAPTSPRQAVWSTGGGEYNIKARLPVMSRMLSAVRALKRFAAGKAPGSRG